MSIQSIVENQRERFILEDSDICSSDADGGEGRGGGRGGCRLNILHLPGEFALSDQKSLNKMFPVFLFVPNSKEPCEGDLLLQRHGANPWRQVRGESQHSGRKL